MKGRKRLRLLLVLAAFFVSAIASANGRFPRAQRLVEDAEQPECLALYGTYGLLTTTDAGQSWQYICEGATGPFSGEAPLLELLPEGRLVLSSETGLQTSGFPGCNWQPLLEPMLPSVVQDITRDAANPGALWAPTATAPCCAPTIRAPPGKAFRYRARARMQSPTSQRWRRTTRTSCTCAAARSPTIRGSFSPMTRFSTAPMAARHSRA